MILLAMRDTVKTHYEQYQSPKPYKRMFHYFYKIANERKGNGAKP